MKKLSVIVQPGETWVIPVNKMNDDNESRAPLWVYIFAGPPWLEHTFSISMRMRLLCGNVFLPLAKAKDTSKLPPLLISRLGSIG